MADTTVTRAISEGSRTVGPELTGPLVISESQAQSQSSRMAQAERAEEEPG